MGPVAATKKACMAPDGIMVQESDFLKALATSVQAEVHDGKLWLTATDGSALVFTDGGSKQ